MIYIFFSNKPLLGDINSSNLSFFLNEPAYEIVILIAIKNIFDTLKTDEESHTDNKSR